MRSGLQSDLNRERVGAGLLPLGTVALLCAMLLVSLPGCSGCRRDVDPKKQAEEARKKLLEEQKKKKERPKPDFELRSMVGLPHDEQPVQRLKPGHWVSVAQNMRVNNFDFQGQATWYPVDGDGRRAALQRTGYRMEMSRPLSLAKKQKKYKQIEMTLFAPRGGKRTNFVMDLTERSGRKRFTTKEFFTHMEAHEYFFVVLAQKPDRYTYLRVLDSMKPPTSDEIGKPVTFYHVLLPKIEGRAALPSSMLTWTSTAYVLWDDVEPGRLMVEQQQALVDWIHWGGQLLVSGPESLDTLRGSFLDPYLPAGAGKVIELNDDDFELINDDWTAPVRGLGSRPLKAVRPWSAVDLQLPSGGSTVEVLAATPDGRPLVVERRVGRGRVVVTAFRLRERDLVNWPGFDGFLNGCLLRRQPREFSQPGDFNELHVDWWDPDTRERDVTGRLDPRKVTQVSLFSRDVGYQYRPPRQDEFDEYGQLVQEGDADRPATSGVGGWDDFNAVSGAARETIRQAAGIEIPDASFVLSVLAAYLVILVPLNWTVFRLIGRIEWAWVMAPVIAVACAAVVIKLAQLDIGFARSNTEIAVIELQGEHPRAHVTRYTALYTSLSTPYVASFDSPAALVQPFAADEGFVQPMGTVPETVGYFRSSEVELSGFRVLSNRTGLLHSEQMIDLGGGISMTTDDSGNCCRILNETEMDLESAAVVRRDKADKIAFAWCGELRAGMAAEGVTEYSTPDGVQRLWPAEPDSPDRTGVALDMRRLVRLALDPAKMHDGDVRLVAVARGAELPGMSISPTAPQKRAAALVVANLRYGDRAAPHADINSRLQFGKQPPNVSEERTEVAAPEDESP